jgi:Dolichyl-phosphate-mannose-protein mannosyltransferase
MVRSPDEERGLPGDSKWPLRLRVAAKRRMTTPASTAGTLRPPALSRRALQAGAKRLPLIAILALQSMLSLRLANTAFQDEALYIYAGHRLIAQLLHNTPSYDNYSTYFSGAPGLYPMAAGVLDGLGGIALARLFSLLCMLAATVAVFWLTNRLFQAGGIFAAALFAVSGPVIFVGHLATFDALSLALLAGGAALAVWSAGRGWWTLIGMAQVLVLAIFVKYAAILFVPSVLALLAIETRRRRGWGIAAVRVFLVTALMAAGTTVALWLSSDALVHGIVETTLRRHVLLGTSRMALARTAVEYAGLLVLLGCAGFVVVWRRRPVLALLLLMSGLLAPLNHIRIAEATSLHKHVAFGFLFLAPLAGLAVARFAAATGPQFLAGLALIAAVFYSGLSQTDQLYSSWPNSQSLIYVLRTQVRPVTGRYLAEEPEVPRYYLRGLIEPYQWSSTYYFEYTKNGRRLTGIDAYRSAIADRYFDVIVLRYGPTAVLDYQIDGRLRKQQGYQLIARLPTHTSFGAGYYWIWRRS